MARRICLLASNVRSLWNVGAFFRTCDAFSVEKIYLTGYTGHPPRSEITKTAIGAEEWIPWEHDRDPLSVLKRLRTDGWQLLALELTDSAIPLQETDFTEKVCLIVGHELSGISQEVLDACDLTVKIPMFGKKESLNVAVATGIALHHLRNASTSHRLHGINID
jgi:tRNA G18 (ribose-2'-O)-methylase SpoU